MQQTLLNGYNWRLRSVFYLYLHGMFVRSNSIWYGIPAVRDYRTRVAGLPCRSPSNFLWPRQLYIEIVTHISGRYDLHDCQSCDSTYRWSFVCLFVCLFALFAEVASHSQFSYIYLCNCTYKDPLKSCTKDIKKDRYNINAIIIGCTIAEKAAVR